MARALFRDTICLRGPAGLIPLAGAQVRFYEPDGGAVPVPISYPLYPDGSSALPLTVPFTTGALGELEVWADQPHRVRVIVTKEGLAQADEIIQIDADATQATTQEYVDEAIAYHESRTDDPHAPAGYLTKPETDALYLPLSHQPGTDPHPQYLQQSVFNQPDPLGQYQLESARGQPSGYVPLDPNALIPTVYLPPLAITDTFVAASQAEMLALTAQRGDVCIRSDTSKSYILAADPASVLGNWKELSAAAPVLSVDGRTGVVDLSDRYAAIAHNHDLAYVAKDGDTMTGQLDFMDGYQGYGGLALQGDSGGVIKFSNGRANFAWYQGGTGPNRVIYDGPLQVFGPLTVGATGAGQPVAVSQQPGNIITWQSDGFMASLTTANVTVLKRQEFFPAAGAATVTLASAPTTVLEVTRNGVAQSETAGHYAVAGAVITFGDAFVTGETVRVLYELGTSVPTDTYTQAQSDARFVNVTGDTMTGALVQQSATGTDSAYRTIIPAEGAARFNVRIDGQVEWGSGMFGTDTYLYRTNTAELTLQGSFMPNANSFRDLGATAMRWRKLWATDADFTNAPTVGGSPLQTQTAADTRYVNATGDTMTGKLTVAPASGDSLLLQGNVAPQSNNAYDFGGSALRWRNLYLMSLDLKGAGAGTDYVFQTGLQADGQPMFQYRANGQVWWGPGGATAPDTSLTRTAAGQVRLAGGTSPAFTARANTSTASGYFGQALAGGRAEIGANVWYDGTQWNRDDTTKGGWIAQFLENQMSFYGVAAGANPATPTQRLIISTVGVVTLLPDAGQLALAARGSVGSVIANATTNRYALDSSEQSDNQVITAANGATVYPFGNVAGGNFSGMFLVNDTASGLISLWMQGGGQMFKVGGATAHILGAAPAAGQLGISLGGTGSLNIAIVNNSGGTSNLLVMGFRTRQNA